MEAALFYFFAFIALTTSTYVVMARSPLNSALSLIGAFFALSGIYVLLGAGLLAALQILVYAGAVMVLFVFVIMLLNIKDEELGEAKPNGLKILGGVGIGLGGLMLYFSFLRPGQLASTRDLGGMKDFGSVEAVGRLIYGSWMLPFEVTSLLLLVAIVAAVIVAKAKI